MRIERTRFYGAYLYEQARVSRFSYDQIVHKLGTPDRYMDNGVAWGIQEDGALGRQLAIWGEHKDTQDWGVWGDWELVNELFGEEVTIG
jgi:hypothetical protein